MKVSLIDYTGCGHSDPDHAINVMIFTKQTRLKMSPGLLAEISSWPAEKKLEELEYMANTIPSSWEFISYTWMIEGVTRAYTHQFVRSRTFSFAQQTHRVLDTSEGPGWEYLTGPTIAKEGYFHLKGEYDDVMARISEGYKWLVDNDAAIEDARGILPTNILTNIVAKCNMRTFVELVHKRSSLRVQGEYRDVLAAMKSEVLKVHPWMNLFIDRTADRAADELQEMMKDEVLSNEARNKMIKLLDQIRKVM